jgi:hypothetical protein
MRFRVERGHVTAFARAIGDAASLREGSVPPTFAAATVLHDPDHMRDMVPVGPLALHPEPGQSLLHAQQEFELLGPLRVGDEMQVTESVGETWTRTNRDGAVLTFTEVLKELRGGDGQVVVRSRMVLVSAP